MEVPAFCSTTLLLPAPGYPPPFQEQAKCRSPPFLVPFFPPIVPPSPLVQKFPFYKERQREGVGMVGGKGIKTNWDFFRGSLHILCKGIRLECVVCVSLSCRHAPVPNRLWCCRCIYVKGERWREENFVTLHPLLLLLLLRRRGPFFAPKCPRPLHPRSIPTKTLGQKTPVC